MARIVDCDYAFCQSNGIDHRLYLDLSNMLRLLFRLEGSSSEDLGIYGLCRLWERHREILKRFNIGSQSLGNLPAAVC